MEITTVQTMQVTLRRWLKKFCELNIQPKETEKQFSLSKNSHGGLEIFDTKTNRHLQLELHKGLQ